MRTLITTAALLALAPVATGQDMPLSQILIDGEGWARVGGNPERPKPQAGVRIGIDGGKRRMTLRVDARDLTLVESAAPAAPTDATPHAVALTRDGGTAYLGYPSRGAVWAFRVGTDGKLSDGAPYCPLRLRPGATFAEVTDLTTDRDGRIYAATEIGVQVFDPTGRLCGVLAPAAPGRPERLAFEGDRLTCWVGDTKYARKLNTTGVK